MALLKSNEKGSQICSIRVCFLLQAYQTKVTYFFLNEIFDDEKSIKRFTGQ
jgi:hypothetical protein